MEMKVRAGFEYVLDEDFTIPVPSWFPVQFMGALDVFSDDRVRLWDNELSLKRGFAWNGANGFPDYNWIMIPSGVHDALLWLRHRLLLSEPEMTIADRIMDREVKRAIDRWFTDLAMERMPMWRRWLTPTGLFFGVNVLSKLSPGPDQAEQHRIRIYNWDVRFPNSVTISRIEANSEDGSWQRNTR